MRFFTPLCIRLLRVLDGLYIISVYVKNADQKIFVNTTIFGTD